MKVLVTGGAGFIGSNFIHYWFGRHPKDEIVNIDKLTYAADPRNLDGVNKYKYQFIKEDIVNRRVVEKIIKDVDVVVNFAAESHVDKSITDTSEFIHSNIVGVHSLLEAVRKYEKRFHQISTDEVYGSLQLKTKKKFNECSPYLPRNPYSATKAAADHLVRSYVNTYGINATISNCGNNYGPRQHVEKLIPKTISNAMADKKVPIYGDGRQVRDWIYVDDHCSAIEAILGKGISGATYLVGAGGEMPNIEIVRLILGELGKPETLVEYVEDRKGHDARYALDTSKIREELEWKSRHGILEGIRSTIEWYRRLQYGQ